MLFATVLGSIGTAAHADFMFTHGDHTYLLVASPTPWASAAVAAGTLSVGGQAGYLAHIEDAAENAAIFAQLMEGIHPAEYSLTRAPDGGGGAYVWIGAQDITSEGTWIWDGDFDGVGPLLGTGTGSTWAAAAYHNWGTTPAGQREPDNGFGNQDSAGISLNGWPFGTAGQWNDVNSANQLYYVVEFNSVVPEPSSGAMFTGALALLGIHRRLRDRKGRNPDRNKWRITSTYLFSRRIPICN